MQANSAPSLRKGAPSPPSRASQVQGYSKGLRSEGCALHCRYRHLHGPGTGVLGDRSELGRSTWREESRGDALGKQHINTLVVSIPSIKCRSRKLHFRWEGPAPGPSWEIAYSGATRGWVIRFGCGIAGKLPECRGLTNERQYSGLPLPLKRTGHRQATPLSGAWPACYRYRHLRSPVKD